MRLQKKIKIFRGLTINLSKSGVTASIGPKGAVVNVGRGRSKVTVGVPGTGLSHKQALTDAAPASAPPRARVPRYLIWLVTLTFGLLFAAWLVSG